MHPWDSFQGSQKRVRNSRDKVDISVRASEVLLYTEECPGDKEEEDSKNLFRKKNPKPAFPLWEVFLTS